MQFRLTVYRESDGITAMQVDAPDEKAAWLRADEQGYSVISSQQSDRSSARRTGSKKFPLLLISQQLLALLSAGLNLVEAFETLAEKEQGSNTQSVLNQVIGALRDGKTLSAGLETMPGAFPPLYVASIRASERTGGIIQALERYVGYQVQVEEARKKVVNALIYPMLLVSVGGLVTLFLLGYVVPKFSRIFEERGTDLPLLTQVLVDWGNLLNSHTWQTLIGATLIAGAAVVALSRPGTRTVIVQQLWKLPLAGEKMRLFQLARMYRTLAMLLKGGMPMVAALELVRDLLDPSLRPQLANATRRISEGTPPSLALNENGLSTPVADRMLRVGEQTGDLGGMMERIGAFYDDELTRAAEIFTRTFEPVLMVLIGLIIGAIVLLMYMPIFELASSIE